MLFEMITVAARNKSNAQEDTHEKKILPLFPGNIACLLRQTCREP